jgi:hypothetical protein
LSNENAKQQRGDIQKVLHELRRILAEDSKGAGVVDHGGNQQCQGRKCECRQSSRQDGGYHDAKEREKLHEFLVLFRFDHNVIVAREFGTRRSRKERSQVSKEARPSLVGIVFSFCIWQ